MYLRRSHAYTGHYAMKVYTVYDSVMDINYTKSAWLYNIRYNYITSESMALQQSLPDDSFKKLFCLSM